MAQGLNLADISALTQNVLIGDTAYPIRGVSIRSVTSLFQRFPALSAILVGGTIRAQDLAQIGPDAVAAIIACGLGHGGDEVAEVWAGDLPLETQMDILEAVAKLTFRSGFGPFAQRIKNLADVAQSSGLGKETPMTTPPQLKPLSAPDSDTTQSGV